MGVDEISIEADGYITREEDIRPLERVTDNTANPARECRYPHCEECRDYVSYQGANYCTVPMVINKQIWHLTADVIADMSREIDELREMVIDHILDEKSRDVCGNYSVEDGSPRPTCPTCAHCSPSWEWYGLCDGVVVNLNTPICDNYTPRHKEKP